ncbi:hypothetical protein MD484_g8122, partial [Candolleomyces efflorescens]
MDPIAEPSLPQETIDDIVDAVAASPGRKRGTLMTLLLAGRCFHHRSRTHLYHTVLVTVDEFDINSRLERLVKLLQRYRHLLPYVKGIVIAYPLDDMSYLKDTASREIARGHNLLAKLFGLLEGLESVEVSNTWRPEDERTSHIVGWGDMDGGVANELRGLIAERSKHTLVSFTMQNIRRLPLSMLLPLLALTTLTILPPGNVEDDSKSESPVFQARLQGVSASCVFWRLANHSTRLGLATLCGHLTHLCLVFNDAKSSNDGWSAIFAAADSLVSLTIEYVFDHEQLSVNACGVDVFPNMTFTHVSQLQIVVYTMSPDSIPTVHMVCAGPILMRKILHHCRFPRVKLLRLWAEIQLALSDVTAFISSEMGELNCGWCELAHGLVISSRDGQLPCLSSLSVEAHVEVFEDNVGFVETALGEADTQVMEKMEEDLRETFQEVQWALEGLTVEMKVISKTLL